MQILSYYVMRKLLFTSNMTTGHVTLTLQPRYTVVYDSSLYFETRYTRYTRYTHIKVFYIFTNNVTCVTCVT